MSSLVASAMFLAGMRLIFVPRLGISEQIALGKNHAGDPVGRIKVVNLRRAEAVNISFELAALRPLAGTRGQNPNLKPYVSRITRLSVRPPSLVSIPRYRKSDSGAEYAFRVASDDPEEIIMALAEETTLIRFRVYAEDAWSRRGKTFERTYTTPSSARAGDFHIGLELTMCE